MFKIPIISTTFESDLLPSGFIDGDQVTYRFDPMTTPTEVVWIRSESALEGILSAWRDLAERAVPGNVFATPDWFMSTWQWLRQGARLELACARRDGELLGVLPLICPGATGSDFPPRRLLRYMAVPDTQGCEVIAAPEVTPAVCDGVLRELVKRRRAWEVLEIPHVPAASATLSAMPLAAGRIGLKAVIEETARNLSIPMDGDWDTYYSTRTRSLKKANNLCANRLKKAGEVTIHWIRGRPDDAMPLERAIEKAVEISSRSWKSDTGFSLDQAGPRRFIETLTKAAARRGWLSLWLLELNGKPLAMEYQLIVGERVHALRSDFDGAYVEVSPGSHLNRQLLEQLFGVMRGQYLMGPGENAYKLRWTSEGEPLFSIRLYSPTLRGQFAYLVDQRLRPLGRRLYALLRPQRSQAPSEAEPEK